MISRLLELADAAFAAGETCVLCTVVRLDGSGYGRPGARLLLTESGQRAGYISGGCLEKDLCRRVWAATDTGPRLIAFDTRGNSVSTTHYNTGCEGVVYVLCQRVDSPIDPSIAMLRTAVHHRCEVRSITVYRSKSDGFAVGDAIAIADTECVSSISISSANSCVARNEFLHLHLRSSTKNHSVEFNDPEGNVVEAAVEIIHSPRELVIFGAGDDVIPVAQSANQLGWQVTVVGHRPELADPARFPGTEVRCGPLAEIAKSLELSASTHALVMTHDFDRDVELLPVLLHSTVQWIGLLGPKRRLGRLVQRLFQKGYRLTDRDTDRIHSPVGLDIGAISPEEIAISIIAELVASVHCRSGNQLHDRKTALHEPCEHIVRPDAPTSSIAGAAP